VSGLPECKAVPFTAVAGARIGFATARRCGEHGATVLLNDVHALRLATELLDELIRRNPFGAATSEEIANVIIFLDSNLSSYMTGAVVSISSQRV
jgi:NAD(P)-dependent dehydrogenase (short-subunit alcohol dehydrogenase family)